MRQFSRYMHIMIILMTALMVLSGCRAVAFMRSDEAGQGNDLPAVPQRAIRIGTLPLEDYLPMWAAEQSGLLAEEGLVAEYVMFQSAQEQIAAMTAGEIDAMTTDMIIATILTSKGTPVKATMVIQGASGGMVAGPGSGIKELADVEGIPIGASSATSIEYIIDSSLMDAGIPQEGIRIEEIKKIPVRYEMLVNDQIKVATLPWPFFSLAIQNGGVALVDYDHASRYTSEVLAVSTRYLEQEEGAAETIATLRRIWEAEVANINSDPSAYRDLLVEKARLPKDLAASYTLNTYPEPILPDKDMVDSIVRWAVDKGYIAQPLTYDDLVYNQ